MRIAKEDSNLKTVERRRQSGNSGKKTAIWKQRKEDGNLETMKEDGFF